MQVKIIGHLWPQPPDGAKLNPNLLHQRVHLSLRQSRSRAEAHLPRTFPDERKTPPGHTSHPVAVQTGPVVTRSQHPNDPKALAHHPNPLAQRILCRKQCLGQSSPQDQTGRPTRNLLRPQEPPVRHRQALQRSKALVRTNNPHIRWGFCKNRLHHTARTHRIQGCRPRKGQGLLQPQQFHFPQRSALRLWSQMKGTSTQMGILLLHRSPQSITCSQHSHQGRNAHRHHQNR